MSTSLPRIQVTRTPAVDRALAVAEREWPGIPRAELVTRLLDAGARQVEEDRAGRRAARRALLERTAGIVDYPDGYVAALREEWPA